MAGGRLWTTEEDHYLEDKVGKLKLETIAKHLNRTVNAVSCRIERLGISNTKLESGKITGAELAYACGVDPHTVYDYWIPKKGLPARRKTTNLKAKFWLIDIKEFWDWAEQNKGIIDFTRIDEYSLLPHPEWVELEQQRDYKKIPKRKRVAWTDKEEQQVIRMVGDSYSKQAIAEKLNRSEMAIQRKISKLRQENKIPFEKINLRWTDEELKIMLDLENQGFADEVIAEELGREPYHIRDKRRRMNRRKIG